MSMVPWCKLFYPFPKTSASLSLKAEPETFLPSTRTSFLPEVSASIPREANAFIKISSFYFLKSVSVKSVTGFRKEKTEFPKS